MIIKIGDIRNCKIGVNIGSELSKDDKFIRPVIILHTHIGGDLIYVAPLTSNHNPKYERNYIKIENYEKYGLDRQSYVLINQIKTISSKRLTRKINNITINNIYIPNIEKDLIKKIKDTYKKLFQL